MADATEYDGLWWALAWLAACSAMPTPPSGGARVMREPRFQTDASLLADVLAHTRPTSFE